MLGYILLHDIIVEFVRLSVSQVVVDLSTMGLDDVSLIRAGAVSQWVILSASEIITELSFMLPAGIFHLHQTSSGRIVFLEVGGVEVSHNVVKFIVTEVFKALVINFDTYFRGRLSFLRKQSLEFSLNLSCLLLHLDVAVLVSTWRDIALHLSSGVLSDSFRSDRLWGSSTL